MKMENSNQTILVTGATGNQGGAVARHLIQRGRFTVHALVRDKSSTGAQAIKQAGAELVTGDLDDRASLDSALRDVYGVFSVQGLKDGLEVEVRQGKVLADAAKAAGVKHFVYSSVGSAERKTGVPHFDSKFRIEQYIRAIGIPYTILRPVFFLYNYNRMRSVLEMGTLSQPLSPETKLQQLSEEDYGEMVADVFERPADFLNRAMEVASVEMTMTDVAAVFSRVLGKPVAYEQMSFEAFEERAGKETTTMLRWFENVGYDADLADLKDEFGEPTNLEAYLCSHGWAKPTGHLASLVSQSLQTT
jgi:uncharacterized protein YbjT (DUF2867 family)